MIIMQSSHESVSIVFIVIQREAPRCSFNLDGHMPKPRTVGRVTDTDSHAFFVSFYARIRGGSMAQ